MSAPTRVRRDRGFALIELLVVLIVMGMLSAVAVPVYLHQKDKGAAASTKTQMRNLIPVITTARENTRSSLRTLTGTWCSVCYCRDSAGNPMLQVSDPAFASTGCGAQWDRLTRNIATAAGEPESVVKALFTDGWGYPITLDENEGESPTHPQCGTSGDLLWSGGANHRILSTGTEPGDLLFRIPASPFCP